MTSADLLADAFGRVRDCVHAAVDNLSPGQLAYRLDRDANSIAWLVWHLTRVQDDHIADVAGHDQVWITKGWADRFGLPFEPTAHGYGHSSEDVGKVQVESGELLTGYYDEVHEQTTRYVRTLTDQDLPRVIDERWDPPVTLGVRLVSVISDDLQHCGQALFIRGIVERQR